MWGVLVATGRSVQVTMKSWALKTLGFNPLACNNETRRADLLNETRGFNTVLPAGNTICGAEGKVHEMRSGNRLCLSAGREQSNTSNKSCGVSVVIGERFKHREHMDPTWRRGKSLEEALLFEPPPESQTSLQFQFTTVPSLLSGRTIHYAGDVQTYNFLAGKRPP